MTDRSENDVLPLYVITDHPRDMPDHFVVRIQYAQRDGTLRVDEKAYGFIELENARAWCAQRGLTRLTRDPDDDPVIVETWV